MHRRGEHVRGVVADQLERRLAALAVMIATCAPSGSGRARSRSSGASPASGWPTSIASAARASPGPIAAAASAPVAPSGSSSGVAVGECHRDRHLSAAGYPPRPRDARAVSTAAPQRAQADCQSASSPSGVRAHLAGADELDQRALGRGAVGLLVVLRHDRRDLLA